MIWIKIFIIWGLLINVILIRIVILLLKLQILIFIIIIISCFCLELIHLFLKRHINIMRTILLVSRLSWNLIIWWLLNIILLVICIGNVLLLILIVCVVTKVAVTDLWRLLRLILIRRIGLLFRDLLLNIWLIQVLVLNTSLNILLILVEILGLLWTWRRWVQLLGIILRNLIRLISWIS